MKCERCHLEIDKDKVIKNFVDALDFLETMVDAGFCLECLLAPDLLAALREILKVA